MAPTKNENAEKVKEAKANKDDVAKDGKGNKHKVIKAKKASTCGHGDGRRDNKSNERSFSPCVLRAAIPNFPGRDFELPSNAAVADFLQQWQTMILG